LFVSPVADVFLSAYGKIGKVGLPKNVPEGLLERNNPFLTSYSAGTASYARLEPEIEGQLHSLTDEFGRVARVAITRKFDTAPS
jgi:hypothetical protein